MFVRTASRAQELSYGSPLNPGSTESVSVDFYPISEDKFQVECNVRIMSGGKNPLPMLKYSRCLAGSTKGCCGKPPGPSNRRVVPRFRLIFTVLNLYSRHPKITASGVWFPEVLMSKPEPVSSFQSLGLPPELIRALEDVGYENAFAYPVPGLFPCCWRAGTCLGMRPRARV